MGKRKVHVEQPKPGRLYSLTQRQARWLSDARDTEGGAYVGLVADSEPGELVEGGAATYREVRQSSGTRSVHDSRPCEWTDMYIVPTEYGLELLRTRRERGEG